MSTGRHAKSKPRRKIYIQDINPVLYTSGPRGCRRPSEKQSSARYRFSKTPAQNAHFCGGYVRLGKDLKTLYRAQRQLQRNPHFRGTGLSTGSGAHVRFYWKKIYDQRTGKPFRFTGSNKSDFLSGLLYAPRARTT